MKTYLIGGGKIEEGEGKSLFRKFSRDKNILVFHWTTNDPKSINKWRKIFLSYFKKVGAKQIEFAELSDSFDVLEKKVKEADTIYLPGGDTETLLENIKKHRVEKLLRNTDKTIAGLSAGAYVLCKNYIEIRDKKHKVIPMLRIAPFSIKCHYTHEFKKQLIAYSKTEDVYGIPDLSAIVWDGKKKTFFHKVSLFSNRRVRNKD